MTSKLKCPACNVPLTECGDLLFCPNDHCAWAGNAELWQALIQSQKDLEIARQALEEIGDETGEDRAGFSYVVLAINMKETAEKALEQITHDNSEKANSVEHKDENNG